MNGTQSEDTEKQKFGKKCLIENCDSLDQNAIKCEYVE